jgi:hypothetical protein
MCSRNRHLLDDLRLRVAQIRLSCGDDVLDAGENFVPMLKSVLVAGLAVAVIAGTGTVALGTDAKATFDSLNRALADSVPAKKKASARDVADWIERYRTGASGMRCGKTKKRWDYVCVFKDGQGRRVKMGVIVDSRQPIEMSPVARLRRPLPPPLRD